MNVLKMSFSLFPELGSRPSLSKLSRSGLVNFRFGDLSFKLFLSCLYFHEGFELKGKNKIETKHWKTTVNVLYGRI